MPTPDHAAHDRTLIAALSMRDPHLSGPERAEADALRAGCPECARLHDDLERNVLLPLQHAQGRNVDIHRAQPSFRLNSTCTRALVMSS